MSQIVDSLLQTRDTIERTGRHRTSRVWTEEENKEFIKSIKSQFPNKQYLTSNITPDIDWNLISEATKRSISKCRKQWNKLKVEFTSKASRRALNLWDHTYDTSNLITILYENRFESESAIDWKVIKRKFIKY